MKTNLVGHCKEGTSDKVYIVSIVTKNTPDGGSVYSVIAKNGRIYKSMKTHQKGDFAFHQSAAAEQLKIFRTKTDKRRSHIYVDIESPEYLGVLTMVNPWLINHLASSKLTGPPDPSIYEPEADADLDREVANLLVMGKILDACRAVKEKTGCTMSSAKKYVKRVGEEKVTTVEPELDENALKWEVVQILKSEGIIQAVRKVRAKTKWATTRARDFVNDVQKKIDESPEAYGFQPRDWEVECVNAVGMEDRFDEGVTYVAERHVEKDMICVWDRYGQKQECFSERFK